MDQSNDQQNATDNQQPGGQQAGEDKEIVIGQYRVKIIKHLCIGAASCVAVSPEVFELDGENIAVFKNGGTDTEDNLLAAAQSCPTKAIEIFDKDTGAQVWPM